MTRGRTFLRRFTIAAMALATPAFAGEPEPRPATHRACLSPAESREEIKAKHLLEPYAVLKSAAAQYRAEALSAKLCRTGDEYLYEIALLHRDGKYMHVVMNALTGKAIETHHPREPAPKN